MKLEIFYGPNVEVDPVNLLSVFNGLKEELIYVIDQDLIGTLRNNHRKICFLGLYDSNEYSKGAIKEYRSELLKRDNCKLVYLKS